MKPERVQEERERQPAEDAVKQSGEARVSDEAAAEAAAEAAQAQEKAPSNGT